MAHDRCGDQREPVSRVCDPSTYTTADQQFQGQQARLLVAVDLRVPFFASLIAEVIANDRPILIEYDGHQTLTKFGIFSLSREENDYIELTEVCLAILDLI